MTTTSLEELIVAPEFTADPYPLLHRLQEEEPVYWSDASPSANKERPSS